MRLSNGSLMSDATLASAPLERAQVIHRSTNQRLGGAHRALKTCSPSTKQNGIFH